jgi:mono/diheme cytochrome c family protein
MGRGSFLKATATLLCGGAVAAGLAGYVHLAKGSPRSHFANADNTSLVIRGKQVYAAQCASCHGRSLQGQPLWRTVDANQALRAPALNETGPDWMRSDEELFATVADGHLPSVTPDPRTRMPAFSGVLAQSDILAVLAFIKARWPISLRVAQAVLNPGGDGSPRKLPPDWHFPPVCMPGGVSSNQASINSLSADPR